MKHSGARPGFDSIEAGPCVRYTCRVILRGRSVGPSTSRGSARTLLVVAGTLALVCIAVVVLFLREPGPGAEPARADPTPTNSAPVAPPPIDHSELSGETHERSKPAAPVPVSSEVVARLRILVEQADGSDWTSVFELHLEPVAELGRADTRPTIVMQVSGARVDVHDVDTGRYRAWAGARARRSTTVEFALRAPPAPVEEVVLVIQPAGVLRGRLVDGKGGVLDGLTVSWRSNLTLDRGAETTDLGGHFVIPGVLDGSYTLLVGPELDPIRTFDAVEHHGVDTDLGELVIPGLGSLRVTVRDVDGAPVAGARVWEAGVARHFDLVTDQRGQCSARHLPAGQYRVFASHDRHGEVNYPVKLEPGADGDLQLVFTR